ncbi:MULTISPECIES: LUD domain-containing protein [unclassified Aureispira]|uniref:LutC/YkgG family protein n=1 Tax=unclassified Aureispira TaxID=2649989 RepID=UPI0007C6BA87|nr:MULTISPECIES: LUD domain-containing protein [unclassified Aureispira]WMX15858.1 LUD domain-containing protein [Aureispira sp. CCB-E]
MQTAKDNILGRLKNIKNHTPTLPYPNLEKETISIYPKPTEALDVLFAQNFQNNGGKFVFCESQKELITNLHLLTQQKKWTKVYCWEKELQQLLNQQNFSYQTQKESLIHADASLTTCEALIARTGSILLSSNAASGRSLSIVPPVHIVIATSNQVIYNLKEVLNLQTAREDHWPSMLCFTSTNSRTADIEKTLVNGAHGPKELYVFFLEI